MLSILLDAALQQGPLKSHTRAVVAAGCRAVDSSSENPMGGEMEIIWPWLLEVTIELK